MLGKGTKIRVRDGILGGESGLVNRALPIHTQGASPTYVLYLDSGAVVYRKENELEVLELSSKSTKTFRKQKLIQALNRLADEAVVDPDSAHEKAMAALLSYINDPDVSVIVLKIVKILD